MTLGRLMELYQAEQRGKQIMMKTRYDGLYSFHKRISEVKLTECELKDLVLDGNKETTCTFFIKDEEDEYGYKIT